MISEEEPQVFSDVRFWLVISISGALLISLLKSYPG